jgi:drug/metabolite transporter (DMT)-like permease
VDPRIALLVLAAALLHATWNALLRSGQDRLAAMTLMCMVSGAAGVIAGLASPAPNPAVWPFAVLSTLIQIAYCVVLVRAYDRGELSQIYPITRGSAPLLVALGALIAAGERPEPAALLGLVMVSGGIMGLALGRDRPHIAATLAALAGGVLIAGYTVSDGVAVRLSGHPTAYIGWMYALQGAPMPLVYRLMRGRWPPIRRDGDTAKGVAGGLLSALSYGVVVWAMGMSPMARVAGLRETGILFAAIIGVVFLKERFTLRRGVCAVLIAAGAALLAH